MNVASAGIYPIIPQASYNRQRTVFVFSMQARNSRSLGFLFFAIPAVALGWHPEGTGEQLLAQIQQSIQSGDLRTAKSSLEQALSRSPEDPQLHNLLGVVEAQENDFTAAESSFQHAIQRAPQFTGAYLNLGRLYQEHPNQPQAREKGLATYQKLLDFEPNQVEANYQAAWLLNRLGSYSESLAHLARLPKELSSRSQALALECADNAGLRKTAQAEAAGKELLASADLVEVDVVPIVPILVESHSSDLAMRLLEGLDGRGLASAETQRQLANLYEAAGKFKDARTILEKSFQSKPPASGALFQLARLAYRAGDREGALGYLAHARELEPGNAAIHFFFGMVCVELKLPPEAEKSLKEAVRLDPGNAYFNYALGSVLVNSKKPEGPFPVPEVSRTTAQRRARSICIGRCLFRGVPDACRPRGIPGGCRAARNANGRVPLSRKASLTGRQPGRCAEVSEPGRRGWPFGSGSLC